jgi:hypothetical protein
MMSFFETLHCQGRRHCKTCRNLVAGRPWREQVLRIFKTEAPVDFVCPFGIPWGGEATQVVETQIRITERPKPTIKQVGSFGQAVISGEYVSKEILEERTAICGKCEYLRVDPNGIEWCAVCGCKTSSEDRKINNLAAYKERLPHWGCKHPKRRILPDKGWKR